MKSLFICCLLLYIIPPVYAQQSCPKWGPYVKALHTPGQADLMMADVMMPADGMAPFTYACSVQFGIGKSGGYSGIQNKNSGEEKNSPLNNIFSIWNFPNKIQILCTYKDPLTFVGGFGGEGTGLHAHADFGWEPGHWYTNVVRCWFTGGDRTSVGYWMLDQTAGTWRHYATFSVHEADATLHGDIASFLENFADNKKSPRTARYKAYWMLRTDGKWIHPDTLQAQAGEGAWKAEKYGTDGIQVTSCGMENGPREGYRFAVETGHHPDIGKPVVHDAASYYDRQTKILYVDWSLQPTSTPQLSYEIDLYDNRAMQGKPLAKISETDPDKTMASLQVENLHLQKQNYYISMRIKDIFNQQSEVRRIVLRDLKP